MSVYPESSEHRGREIFPFLFNNMEIVAFDRMKLTAQEIYFGLVRINSNGDYYYYTVPWKEKITLWLPSHIVRAHDTGNLDTLTLIEKEDGSWTVRDSSIYLEESFYMRKKKLQILSQRKRETL